MYRIGEFRNSVFDDSEDINNSRSASSSSANSPTPMSSSHFEMIRQQMMMATPVAGQSFDHLDMGLSGPFTSSDSCLPSRVDASSLIGVLSKSSEMLDRDQALRHSHVIDTVRSLKVDEKIGHWTAQAEKKHVASAAISVNHRRGSSTLPSARDNRQTVSTHAELKRTNALPPGSARPKQQQQQQQQQQLLQRGQQPPPPSPPPRTSRQPIRRHVSDPTGVRGVLQPKLPTGRTRDSLGRNQSLDEGMEEPTLGRRGSGKGYDAADAQDKWRSATAPKPPRTLPPINTSNTRVRKNFKKHEQFTRTKSEGNDGEPCSPPARLATAAERSGSLKSRPSTGRPPVKADGSPTLKSPSSKFVKSSRASSKKRKPSIVLKVREKFSIPDIVITTCPDMDFSLLPQYAGPRQPSSSASSQPRKTSSSTRNTRRTSTPSSQKHRDANTAMGAFTVS